MLDEIVMPFFRALGRSRHLTLHLRFTSRDNGGNTFKFFWMYWSNVFVFFLNGILLRVDNLCVCVCVLPGGVQCLFS